MGGIDEAELETVRAKGPIRVSGVSKHFSGVAAGDSVLSLGEEVVAEGSDWKTTKPKIAVVVKGHGYKPDQEINIPKKAKTISKVFGS